MSTNSAAMDDVEIYDKENELIAKADKVVIYYRFLADFETISIGRVKWSRCHQSWG